MSKASILVVEDEVIIAMEIENSLKNLGYEVTSVVNSGDKAIQDAAADKPDLILMDIRIQGDKDGIETAEIIRNTFGIPVVFSTAYLDKERIERAKITMPFGYVLKPIQQRDLQVTLEMALYVAKVDAERRKTEEELKRSEELLNNTGEMARVGGWEVNLEKQTVYWSNATKLIHEVPPDYEPSLEEAINYFPGESGRLINEAIHEAIKNGKSYELVLDFLTAKGTMLKVWTIGHSEFENGKCSRLYGTFQDITELKKTEEELKKSEEWFSTTLRSIGDAVITTDKKGFVTSLNPVAEKLTGWKQEEAKGKPLLEIFNVISEKTRKPVENPVQKVLKEDRIVGLANHTILIAKDGTEIPIDDSGSPIRSEKGEIYGVVLVFRDIIERKKSEEALRESEEKHRALFETMTQGVVYQNAEGIITDANPAAERILGLSLDQLQGKTSMDPRWKAIHEDGSDFPGENHPIPIALKTGKPVKNVIHGVYDPDKKEYRWIRVSAVPKFKDGENTPYEAYAIFDDITDERKGKK